MQSKSSTVGLGRFLSLLVFLGGAVLTASFYVVLTSPTLEGTTAHRYFCGHPIEVWTTWLFFWGVSALGAKAMRLVFERRALRMPIVRFESGVLASPSEAAAQIDSMASLPGSLRGTWYVRRLMEALGYVQQRGSAQGLEERLEVLADRDANELEGSYELVRMVTWAIPILGFLGTVIGITIAIANITPEQLQESLSEVVGGLAVAFDTTALALALSMAIVLLKFLVERAERGMMARVDTALEEAVLHRFQTHAPETQAFLGAVEGVARVVMQATRDAWREQGQLWARTVEQSGESQLAALQDFTQKVFERNEQSVARQDVQFRQFLQAMDGSRQAWHKALSDVAAKMTAHQAAVKRQVELIAQLVADEGRLSKLQQTLQTNLATLANVQALEEAVHSLSAAAHLLTARAGRGTAPRLGVSHEGRAEEAA